MINKDILIKSKLLILIVFISLQLGICRIGDGISVKDNLSNFIHLNHEDTSPRRLDQLLAEGKRVGM